MSDITIWNLYKFLIQGKIKGLCFLRHNTEHTHFLDLDNVRIAGFNEEMYIKSRDHLKNTHKNKRTTNTKIIKVCKQELQKQPTEILYNDTLNTNELIKNREKLLELYDNNSFNYKLIISLLTKIENLETEVKNGKKTKQKVSFGIGSTINNN